MKNIINKTILFAAVVFAAGLSNISANAAGAVSGGFSTGSTNFIIGVAVGYAENGTDPLTAVNRGANVDANNACLNHPDSDNCGIITDFANQYFAVYADLSDIANIETWTETGMNAADAQAAAMALCTNSANCDCIAVARDITENAIEFSVAYSFTTADAGSTTTCDTVIEPDVCDGTTATVNEARTACECATDELPILETGGLSCRAIESAEDCPGEFFNNAVSPARCDPLPNCDTATAELNTETNMCVCNADHRFVADSTTTCEPITAADCGQDGRPDFWDGSMCVADCGDDFVNPANPGETCRPIDAADCGQDSRPDFWDGSMCVADCGANFVNPANAGETCRPIAEVLATVSVSPTYTAESCENAQWQTEFVFSGNNRQEVAEVCGIPVERNDNLPAAARESQPQIANGEIANGCIIRMSDDFDKENSTPDISAAVRCDDPELFGESGFPQMPENFNIATDRLIIVVADGRNRIFFNDNEIRIAVASPRNNDAEVAIIGAVGVAMAMYAIADFLHDGRPADAFAFSPEFGYRISENDYFVRAGGKIEYAVNENLRMQWSAGQTNTGGDFGDFRYLSKAEYTADFWAATFSESVAGKTADYDFSLSADLQNGIWKISPVYRMQSEWKESDSGIKTETQNELNLESVLRYNRWTIRPSAGFRWQNFGEFTENGKLQMNAVYRF